MKILHINSYYSTGKFYKNLYDNQISNGQKIDVFIPVPSSFKNKGFDYGSYSTISRNHKKHDRYIFHLKHHKIYKDILLKYDINKYGIIHAHSLFSNGYIAMRLKKQYGIPYIVAIRNTDVNVFFKQMFHLRKLGVNVMKEASQIIFLSKAYKKYTIERYIPKHLKETINNKSSIIPNGIDDFWFSNKVLSPKKFLNKKRIRLLQVADINKNKNIKTTIKAINLLIKKGYNVKLDVVGKVKDKTVFDKIKKFDYVNYLGYKSKEELIKIYRENDIFILPSVTETFGLVYPEAMSQGLPVIYTKGQGFDGQFEDGEVGFAVNCFDAKNIADKIVDTVNNYQEISNNCIKQCKRFDWSIIEKKYNDVYVKSLNQNL